VVVYRIGISFRDSKLPKKSYDLTKYLPYAFLMGGRRDGEEEV